MNSISDKYPISLYYTDYFRTNDNQLGHEAVGSHCVLRDNWWAFKSFHRMSSRLVLWWTWWPLRCPEPTTANIRAFWTGESGSMQRTCPTMRHIAFFTNSDNGHAPHRRYRELFEIADGRRHWRILLKSSQVSNFSSTFFGAAQVMELSRRTDKTITLYTCTTMVMDILRGSIQSFVKVLSVLY